MTRPHSTRLRDPQPRALIARRASGSRPVRELHAALDRLQEILPATASR